MQMQSLSELYTGLMRVNHRQSPDFQHCTSGPRGISRRCGMYNVLPTRIQALIKALKATHSLRLAGTVALLPSRTSQLPFSRNTLPISM